MKMSIDDEVIFGKISLEFHMVECTKYFLQGSIKLIVA